MIYIIYLILAIISSASLAIVLKIFRNQEGNRYGILFGNYLTCMVLSALFLLFGQKDSAAASGQMLQIDAPTLICGLIAGFLFVAGLVGMQSSIQKNGAILTSAFSKMGLIVPLAVSLLFLHESWNLTQVLGIILVLAAVWIISMDRQNADGGPASGASARPWLLFVVLLACGSADAMAKIFEHLRSSDTDALYFLILFSMAAVLTAVLLIAEYRRTKRPLKAKEFLTGILAGIPNYFSSYLLLQALKGLPSFVVYPVFSTGSLLLITVISIAAFQEHPSRRKWVGLGITAAALVILSV